MTFFADTNWLAAAYFIRKDQGRTESVERHSRKQQQPWIVSHLVLLEARNVFGRLSGESNPVEWVRLQGDLGRRIYVGPMVWDLQRQRSLELLAKYSHKAALGTFDVALVASALLAGTTHFLSFDERAKALAVAERLAVYPALGGEGKGLLGILRSK